MSAIGAMRVVYGMRRHSTVPRRRESRGILIGRQSTGAGTARWA